MVSTLARARWAWTIWKTHEERLKWEKEHPEEVKKQTEQIDKKFEEYEKWREQHPEVVKQEERLYVKRLEDRIIELEKTLQDFTESFKKETNYNRT